MNIESTLSTARTLLADLGNALSNLVNSFPEGFTDPAIASRLEDFQQTYETATQRLNHPSLSIATLGTTSSGKSTIVNALMGRRIAPIEAGEMSGGVLTLRHSQECELVIEATPGAAWETGSWTGLSDEELYRRIKAVMNTYHEVRKLKECIAPQITVSAPLFPAGDLSLSGLPAGIGIEFLDLPGLKSVQDRANLQVIQPLVGKAFSLVALDYMQVDEEHRQKLLGELKQVVEFLHGRTDSMIFILNRVDNRGSDDLPIAVRLEKLQEEIQQVLGLAELPDVIPFNARLLYYAQCAWGTGALNDPSQVNPQVRSQLLKAFFQECAAVIKERTAGDRSLRDWLRKVEDDLEDGQPLDDYKMRRIMYYAMEWSGGKALWDCIRTRVQESFSELVILPALFDVFNNFDALTETLDILVKTSKISNQEQVKAERNKIATIRRDLQKNVKRIGDDFQKEVREYIDALKTNDSKTIDKAKAEAKKKGREGFSLVFDAVAAVEGDLTISLIAPVRDALQKNDATYTLEEKLQEVIAPPLAKDITKTYDHLRGRINNFSVQSESLYRKVKADDKHGKMEIEHDERRFRLLYYTMRQAITARAEFLLQTKAKQFEDALQSLVNDQLKRLDICFTSQEIYSINIEQSAVSDLRKKLGNNLIKLPENLFQISDTIKQIEKLEQEVIGQETYNKEVTRTKYEKRTEYYTTGSCFKETKTRFKDVPVNYTTTEQETRDKYGVIEYVEIYLPSPQLMGKQWSEGITQGKEALWDILFTWITEYLDVVSKLFEESIVDLTDLAERRLAEQLTIIELNFEEKKQFWQGFEIEKNKVDQSRKKLESEFR